ncbi:MAG TPA: cell division protein ZapA [Rubricoccaceae bacterium]|nr:cell division protein ZapA [Rubricoccaceae bacterium]
MAEVPLHSIRVRILDREYPLRVAPADEAYMRHLAQLVDERLQRIRQGLPTQPDLTHAVLGALEIAEELFMARAETDRFRAQVELDAAALTDRLDALLASEDGGPKPPKGKRTAGGEG